MAENRIIYTKAGVFDDFHFFADASTSAELRDAVALLREMRSTQTWKGRPPIIGVHIVRGPVRDYDAINREWNRGR